MAYVDTNIITAYFSKQTCEKVFDIGTCKDYESENPIKISILKKLQHGIISRQALKEDFPSRIRERPDIWVGLSIIREKGIDVQDVDKDRAFFRGKTIIDNVCKEMSKNELNFDEKVFYGKFCRGDKIITDTELIETLPEFERRSFNGDLIHLGSASLLNESEFYSLDKSHISPLKRFIKEFKIKDVI